MCIRDSANREQVEQRLEEAGQDHHPAIPVDEEVALDQEQRASPAEAGWEDAPEGGQLQHRQRSSRRRNMTNIATAPPTANVVRTTTWATCTSGSCHAVSSASDRARSTPCHSGSSQASGRMIAGSCSIGKNVPENRNRGVMPKRQIELNADVSRCEDMKAAIGPAKASAVSVPTGTEKMIPGVAAAPNSTMTTRKIEPTSVARVAIQA